MTDDELKDFRNAIHEGLKIIPETESSRFIVRENEEKSAIQKIEFKFKNNNDILMIQQDNNKHTISNMLKFKNSKKIPTGRSCDFIVFMLDKNRTIKTYFCEIKSSCSNQELKKACEQIQASKLFFKYLIDCYSTYTQNNYLKDCNIDIAKCYYIYPRPSISAKGKTHKDDNVNSKISNFLQGTPYECDLCRIVLQPKPVFVGDNKVVEVLEYDIDDFFS